LITVVNFFSKNVGKFSLWICTVRNLVSDVKGGTSMGNIWIKHNEVTEGWRGLHFEELRNLHSSSNVIVMIK
jgi:hypothetical protein